MTKQTIHLATDHAGFELKEAIKQFLTEQNYKIIDHGALTNNPTDDYPDFIIPAVESAIQNNDVAIVFGGTGIGECIAAGKVRGARAALVYSEALAEDTRTHNDSNVLCLGGRTATQDVNLTKSIVSTWLETDFSGEERHDRRLQKISDYENKK